MLADIFVEACHGYLGVFSSWNNLLQLLQFQESELGPPPSLCISLASFQSSM